MRAIRVRGFDPLVTLGCLLAAPVAAAAHAPAAAARTPTTTRTRSVAAASGKAGKWSFQVEIAGRWDDNIIKLSDADRQRIGDPMFADRFKIVSPDDWVLTPSVRVGYTRESAGRLRTTARLEAKAARYRRNPIKNYEVYGLRVAQGLTRSTRYGTRLVLRGGFTPGFYLRELTVPQATLDHRRTVRDSARFSETSFSAALEQVLVPRQLELEVRLETARRRYDSPFRERDGNLTGYHTRLEWRPGANRPFSLRAGYGAASYDAAGDRAETPAFEPDISSRRRALTVGTEVRWKSHGRRGSVSLDLSRERRDFSSTAPIDRFHFGRRDAATEWRLTVDQAITGNLYLEADVLRERNDSTLGPRAPISGGDDVTDYTRNVVSISFGWRL